MEEDKIENKGANFCKIEFVTENHILLRDMITSYLCKKNNFSFHHILHIISPEDLSPRLPKPRSWLDIPASSGTSCLLPLVFWSGLSMLFEWFDLDEKIISISFCFFLVFFWFLSLEAFWGTKEDKEDFSAGFFFFCGKKLNNKKN